jgi:hypothetical protein
MTNDEQELARQALELVLLMQEIVAENQKAKEQAWTRESS